jgi:hypothetical protein
MTIAYVNELNLVFVIYKVHFSGWQNSALKHFIRTKI